MNTETFGRRITRLRERMGVNKAELARLADMTRTAIGQYEERETADKCQVQHLRNLSNVLSISMDYLIDGKDRTGPLEETTLAEALTFVNQIIPNAEPEKQAKLVKFVYGLRAQGKTADLGIVNAFYQAL